MEVRCPLYKKCDEAPNCGAAKPHDERYCEPCPREPGLICQPYASIACYVIGENIPPSVDDIKEQITQAIRESLNPLIHEFQTFGSSINQLSTTMRSAIGRIEALRFGGAIRVETSVDENDPTLIHIQHTFDNPLRLIRTDARF
jgi:hypothetical protein